MKRFYFSLACALLLLAPVRAQDSAIAAAENLIVDGVPKIQASLAETAGRYASYRSASLADWHPTKREMLIATRFGDTPQLHLLKMPGGERQQLTFFADSVGGGRFHPNGGDYILFAKDIGGGGGYQVFRFDFATGGVMSLSGGKWRKLPGPGYYNGVQIASMFNLHARKDPEL